MSLDEQIADYKKSMDEAIANNNGWLTHFYGSSWMKFCALKSEFKRKRFENAKQMIDLKYSCETNTLHSMIQCTINNPPNYNWLNKKRILKEHQEFLDELYKLLEESNLNYKKELEKLQCEQ